MATKLTVSQKYENIISKYGDMLDKADLDFLVERKELVEKKNASRKPSAKNEENEGIKANILAEMEEDKAYTITDMMKNLPSCKELSNQRISALVRQLIDKDLVERNEIKGKAYFTKI